MCCTPMPREGEEKVGYIIRRSFRSPEDERGGFAVSAWVIRAESAHARPVGEVVDTIEEARAMIPAGLRRIERNQDDGPTAVEGWV